MIKRLTYSILFALSAYGTVIAQKPFVCITPKLNYTLRFNLSERNTAKCLADNYYLWDNGKTLYIKFFNGSKAVQQKVRLAASEWEKVANIKFEFVENGKSNERIEFTNRGYSTAPIGTLANMYSQDEATVLIDTSNTNVTNAALHLFGHVLGLEDEIEGSENKDMNAEKAQQLFRKQGIGITSEQAEEFLQKYSFNISNGLQYDSLSIMTTSFPFSSKKKQLIGVFSTRDKKIMDALYPKKSQQNPEAYEKATFSLDDLKMNFSKQKGGLSFYPVFDIANKNPNRTFIFAIYLSDKNGVPFKAVNSDEYRIDGQLGVVKSQMSYVANLKGINKKKTSDLEMFIPNDVLKSLDTSKGMVAVLKVFCWQKNLSDGRASLHELSSSKPFEVKF